MRISGQAIAHSWSSSAKERAPFRRFSGLYTELNPCKSRCIKALGASILTSDRHLCKNLPIELQLGIER